MRSSAAVSHRTADNVLKQQAKLLENQIDAFAGRLSTAADATDVQDLVKTQFRMIPENASLFLTDARNALGIVAGAGTEVRDLLKGTVAELRGSKKTAAGKTATPRKKTAKKKIRAGKKTAARSAREARKAA